MAQEFADFLPIGSYGSMGAGISQHPIQQDMPSDEVLSPQAYGGQLVSNNHSL